MKWFNINCLAIIDMIMNYSDKLRSRIWNRYDVCEQGFAVNAQTLLSVRMLTDGTTRRLRFRTFHNSLSIQEKRLFNGQKENKVLRDQEIMWP